MADRENRGSELVFCHQCQNEWNRDEHGLECPECHSEFVEVVEEDHDPRDTHVEDLENDVAGDFNPDRLPHHSMHTTNPFHNHNPWANQHPHENNGGGVSHVEWSPGPGVHFSRTSYRSSSPNARPGPGMNDPFAPFFQTFSTILEGAGGAARQNGDRGSGTMPFPAAFHQHFQQAMHPHGGSTSPLQEGQARHGFAMGGSMPATPRLTPRDANNPQPNAFPVDNLQGLLGTLIRGMQDMQGSPAAHNNQGAPGFPPLHFFTQFLNPANAQHGDAVYTEEALDRIITQFMDAQNGQTAPGPASEAAIAALPKKKADKSILGAEGKAECSVCMDNVSLGDEVTVLPCSHWFHGECVGAWLKEHDTCPHCRQGIMAKDAGDHPTSMNIPRQPGQEPRNSQAPLSPPDGNNGFHFAWHAGSGPGSPSSRSPHSPSSSRSRRRSAARDMRNSGDASSSGSGNGTGGFTGWVRSHFGGGSNNHE